MPEKLEPDDAAMLEVIRRLEDGSLAARLTDPAAELEAGLRCELTELLGLIPGALEPLDPRPALRSRLLAAVSGNSTLASIQETRASRAGGLRLPRGARLLAAAAVLFALSFAIVSAWLYVSLRQQQATLAGLQAALAEEESAAARLAAVRHDFLDLSQRFELVTEPGVEICRLEPRGDEPPQPAARGRLFIAPDRQRWLLTAHTLSPCMPGSHYRIWFLTDQGVLPGGSFHVKAGEKIEIIADQLPAGVTAVLVTLEPADGGSQPRGPTVLYGDEPQIML